jgi:tetratricopeptide (TPR) repeat protein
MAGNIFINYRREESGHVAGRLHDSLAPTFGSKKLFMDVDNIPAGSDFADQLKSQVAACDAMLAIIGPNWLNAMDESGRRRLDNPDDFVAIEIEAALARKIPVIPVLVDGARMPKASELPDSLKPLAHRQAILIRHENYRTDAEGLIAKMREALSHARPARYGRIFDFKKVYAALALGIGVILFFLLWIWIVVMEADVPRVGQTNKQQSSIDQAIADYSAAVRLDPNNANTFFKRGDAYLKKGDFDRAISDYGEVIRLDPKNANAFFGRGVAYAKKGDLDRAISDYSEVIRLDPKNTIAFANRGADYLKKGDFDRAIADSSEAIRLNPNTFAWVYCNRGHAKLKINDSGGNADIAKARQLDPSICQ